jgi:hypothetical protein
VARIARNMMNSPKQAKPPITAKISFNIIPPINVEVWCP